MDNTILSRDISSLKVNFESVLDNLIQEIEELEGQKNKMEVRIDELESENSDLIERLKEYE